MTTSTVEKPPVITPAGHESLVRKFARGTDFLHRGLVASALKLDLPEPPECQFGDGESDKIKERGNQILWLPAKDSNGASVTMSRLYVGLGNKAPLGGKILYNTDWYHTEEFFEVHTPRTASDGLGSWREVGASAIPGTEGEHALSRTKIAADYVKTVVFNGKPPKHVSAMVDELKKKESEIDRLMRGSEWPKASKMIAELAFNLEFCDTPIEAMIRVVVNQCINRIRLLEGKYSVSSVCASLGGLVFFGDADVRGAYVNGWDPWVRCASGGFFLSRSDRES